MLLNVCELKPWCGRIGGGSERVVQIRDLLLSLSELRSIFFWVSVVPLPVVPSSTCKFDLMLNFASFDLFKLLHEEEKWDISIISYTQHSYSDVRQHIVRNVKRVIDGLLKSKVLYYFIQN